MSETPDAGGEAAEGNASHAAAVLLLVGAAGLFAFIAKRVTAKRTESLDHEVRDWTQAKRSPTLDTAVKPVTVMSQPILVVAATAALSWWLARNRRAAAAGAIGLTPIIAAIVGQSSTMFLQQRNPPDAQDSANGKVEASFPSGHTTGVTAEGLAIAYILAQEGLAPAPLVAALVVWPLVAGASRVYRDRHWATDIFAGWTAGVGVAAASVLLYRLIAPRTGERPPP